MISEYRRNHEAIITDSGAFHTMLLKLVKWTKQHHQPCLSGQQIRTPREKQSVEEGQLCLYSWYLIANQHIHIPYTLEHKFMINLLLADDLVLLKPNM